MDILVEKLLLSPAETHHSGKETPIECKPLQDEVLVQLANTWGKVVVGDEELCRGDAMEQGSRLGELHDNNFLTILPYFDEQPLERKLCLLPRDLQVIRNTTVATVMAELATPTVCLVCDKQWCTPLVRLLDEFTSF
jgi:hypothetical protein